MIDLAALRVMVLEVDGHTCVATDCSVRVRFGVLMCKRHWRMVPQSTQRRINRYWRDWQVHDSLTAPTDWSQAVVEAIGSITAVEVSARG